MYKEEEISFEDLGKRLNITDFENPEIYDIEKEGYEILSFNHETGKEEWKPLKSFVVKKTADTHYQLGTLHGTSAHKVFFENKYIALEEHPDAKLVNEPMKVVDCEVEDNHNYIAEGQINHNTVTPGGKALPYACSVRIRFSGGQQIKKTIDGNERVIGININAKVIKNRLSSPFREVSFEIHFGKGIRESEQVFDVMRLWCDKEGHEALYNGKILKIGGAGAWKTFSVTNKSTGAIEKEVKFYKTDFGKDILYNPEYANEMQALMDAAYVLNYDSEDDENPTVGSIEPEETEEETTTTSTKQLLLD